jgi:aconitate hydratase
MSLQIDNPEIFYAALAARIDRIKFGVERPLTLTEKLLFSHLYDSDDSGQGPAQIKRGVDYVNFSPDRVAMQDATAQMALLQFMNAGKGKVAVPSSVHCDHLIKANQGAIADLTVAEADNHEVYQFLQTVSAKYGIDFWKPGAGIIHQVVLENYAIPGAMIVGTDSHTVNGGGLGMIAIGVGGADAVDVMAGMPWELKMPRLIGVRLTGRLSGWTAPKDVILKLAGVLTAKGGTNAIVEYFGSGTSTISCTGKATICNMGAEIGATTSIFPYDEKMGDYLRQTGRAQFADAADGIAQHLRADDGVLEAPEKYYDEIITIDLDRLEPHINGPFTPDLAHPISEFARAVAQNGYPDKLEVGLIGSCTNSSYEDMTRAASLARQAQQKGLKVQAEYIITPGSEQVRYTAERDQVLSTFESIGGVVMANACGPCIGQWQRHTDDPERKNSIITSFNRNFAKRNDGNPNTYSFVASPEIVTALAIAGRLSFNPLTDKLINEAGESVMLDEPKGESAPALGYAVEDAGLVMPPEDSSGLSVTIAENSERLQQLLPFKAWPVESMVSMPLLIQAQGKCTTDHISMAGPWLKYRGHLDNISNNMLIGAVNRFNGATNLVLDPVSGGYRMVPECARAYKADGRPSVVIAEENYGEGSSREHAAMEPRHLGVAMVITKSFARIHETNLKKQGMLALTFANKGDYERVREDDTFDLLGLKQLAPGSTLTLRLNHRDGSKETIQLNHTYNALQIEWFKAGSALNHLAATRNS